MVESAPSHTLIEGLQKYFNMLYIYLADALDLM